jgi:hypothetical protein
MNRMWLRGGKQVPRISSQWLALFATLLAACNGSGSSGFDRVRPSSENAVIEQVIQGQECMKTDALQICFLAATASPAMQMRVELLSDVERVVADCSDFSSEQPDCQFPLAFLAEGFPSDATFLVAVRTTDPVGTWSLGPDRASPRFSNELELTAVVHGTFLGDDGVPIDVAILAFLSESPPSLPPTVTDLAASGADLVFVNEFVVAGR